MKGKGKKERDTDDDCPLMFIDFKSVDFKDYPRLSALLSRRDELNIGIEDLDSLQLEIESILTSVVSRKIHLENETESLINWQESKAKDKKPNLKQIETSGKRSNQSDEKASKKFKESHQPNHLNATSSGKSHSIRSKSKNVKHQDFEFNDPLKIAPPTPLPPRNDLPDKFWQFVESYCAPVKPGDIKFLEDVIKQCQVDEDLLKVPPLGKNLKWSEADSWDRADSRANMIIEMKKGLSPYNNSSPSDKTSRKGKEPKGEIDKNSFGFLTQRLVSCLIEDNISREEKLDSELDFNEKGSSNSNSNILKRLNLGNTSQLERRIKKELEEQGLLDPEETLNESVDDEEDEILNELLRCQNELKIIAAKNESTLKFLLNAAKKDLNRQELDKKLKAADNEVMEAYKKILCAKQKKRTPTKKEKETANRALREREAIVRQIESIK